MISNPHNSIIVSGHSNGTINMWSPNYSGEPIVKFLAHPTPVNNIAIDRSGNYLVSSSSDKKMKVWDLRNDYSLIYDYYAPSECQSMCISQQGLLAMGYKGSVEIWRDIHKEKQQKPYLKHNFIDKQTYANSMKFIDFEDFLGIGTNKGYSQIIVPGSGEPNFDTYENNPFETKNQKKNSQVKKLLEKIPHSMISLTSEKFINTVNSNSKSIKEHESKFDIMAKVKEYTSKEKNKMRKKNKERLGEMMKENTRLEANKLKYKSIIEKNFEKVKKEKENMKDQIDILEKIDDIGFNPELNLKESDNESFNDENYDENSEFSEEN